MTSFAPVLRPARRSGRRRGGWVLGLLVGLLIAGVASAVSASAHAQLVSTTPTDGESLAKPPASVRLTFSETVGTGLGYLRVVDTDGNRVDDGVITDPDGAGTSVAVGLPADLPAGGYIVSFRVISADSHPVAGAFAFGVGGAAVPSTTSAGAEPAEDGDAVVAAVYAVTRWAAFAGALVFLGAAFLFRTNWRAGTEHRRSHLVLLSSWYTLTVATVLSGLLQDVYAAGRGLGSIFDLTILDATLETHLGRMLSVRLIALAVLGVLLVRALSLPRVPRWVDYTGAVAGIVVLATFGAAGHAVAGIAPVLTMVSDTVHIGAAATWIGGLVVVTGVLLPLGTNTELAASLPRHSRVAVTSVVVLVVTGTYQAWREVGELPALWSTTYGRLLLVKIVGFVVLVGLGAVARDWIQRRYVRPVVHASSSVLADDTDGSGPSADEQVERSRMRRSVFLEVVIAAVVLAATAVLVATPPARDTFSEPVDRTLELPNGGSVQLTVDPARSGPNTVHLYLFDDSGAVGDADADELTVKAEQKADKIGPLELTLVKAGRGHWVGTGTNLPIAGDWTFTVTVTEGEFDSWVVEATVALR